jgi:hypothetical protein
MILTHALLQLAFFPPSVNLKISNFRRFSHCTEKRVQLYAYIFNVIHLPCSRFTYISFYLLPITALYLHNLQHVSADDGWITQPKHVGGCLKKSAVIGDK